MKVLFISRKWPPALGGMETYGFELTRALRKRKDIDLNVLYLRGRSNGRPPGALSIALFFVRVTFHLIINRERYDVIHFGDMVQIGLAWFSRKFSPRSAQVLALHGLDVIYGRRVGALPRIYRIYMNWARRRDCVDYFIANSRNTAKLLTEEGFGPTTVIPLAVRLGSVGEKAPEMMPIARPPFVLFFGRVFRRKGARWFAENVLPLLPAEVEFHVIGSVWDESDGIYLNDHPRVRMLGAFPLDISVEDFRAKKRQAIAIVMPNVRNDDGLDVEGFGLTALEASDNGAPLIAARAEGIKDAVIHGKTGFLEAPEDAAAWAQRIMTLMDWSPEERQSFSMGAGELLRSKYSWSRVAADAVAIYRVSIENR